MRRALYGALDLYLSNQNQLHQEPPILTISSISIRRNHDKHQIHATETTSPRFWITSSSQIVPDKDTAPFNPSRTLVTDPNGHTLVQLIRSCSEHGLVSHGQQLHCFALRSGFVSNVFVSTALVGFYVRLVSCDDAHKLFDDIPQPNVVTWNTMISGYLHSGQVLNALGFFIKLNKSELGVDGFSLTAALSACRQLSWLQLGMSMHCKILTGGFGSSNFIANCLIDMYGKCTSLEESIQVFDELLDKDPFSWNSVLAACVRNQRLEMAMEYFHQIPNPDTVSFNEVINGLAQFGHIDDAVKILIAMPNPNSSSWNSIITAYVNHDRPQEALDLFTTMHANGVEMDEYTFSSILSGIARLSALTRGMLLHSCTIKRGLDKSVVVGSALVDMYAKCGKISDAETMFKLLPTKNTVTWNAMISGFAHNGESNKVISCFEELKQLKSLKPNEITFLNVLAACSHNQMPLETAYMYFSSMVQGYGIEPCVEHLTTMIRIMGKQREVWRAEKMIYEMGFGSCGLIWRALLGACASCGDLKVAEVAAAKVSELEADDDEYGYVTMSNISAGHEKWQDSSRVRETMRKKGVIKQAGRSWIPTKTS
ncbi:hypothetical protein Dimus_008944 [Dionaea muscipula]